MDWYKIVSLIISAISLPTIAGLIWKGIYENRKKSSDHIHELQRNEEREAFRSIIKEEISPLDAKVDSIVSELSKVSDGTLSTLRNDILKCYYACVTKGCRNDYDYTNVHDLYEAYSELHGNSFVQDVMVRFDALPTKEEYRHTHNIGGAKDGEE